MDIPTEIFFTSENSALLAMKGFTKEEGQKFCPLIKAACKPSCVCYQAATMDQIDESEYTVTEPSCTNAMFITAAG